MKKSFGYNRSRDSSLLRFEISRGPPCQPPDSPHELPQARTVRPPRKRAVVRLVGHVRQSARRRGGTRMHGSRVRRRREFFRQRGGLRQGAGGVDHGRGAAQPAQTARVVHRFDQVLLGSPRRSERKEHVEPQIPAAGDRWLARAFQARLCRSRVLPPFRSLHTDRGNGMGDAQHDRGRQGPVLGDVRMERRRHRRRLADRRAPPLA